MYICIQAHALYLITWMNTCMFFVQYIFIRKKVELLQFSNDFWGGWGIWEIGLSASIKKKSVSMQVTIKFDYLFSLCHLAVVCYSCSKHSAQFAKLARDMKIPGSGSIRSKSPGDATNNSSGPAEDDNDFPGGLCWILCSSTTTTTISCIPVRIIFLCVCVWSL